MKTYTDPKLSATSFDYPNATATCGNAFPTTINSPVSNISRSMAYNCTAALPATLTDENGQPASTLAYNDPLLRLTATTDALGNATGHAYTATTHESSMIFNGTSTSDVLTTIDALGRTLLTQKKRTTSPSSTFDSVQTDRSIVGNTWRFRTSVPYIAAAGGTSTTGGATVTYDALGRPLVTTDAGGGTTTNTYTNNDVLTVLGPAPVGPPLELTKKKQLQYDGLGRLKSLCEITTGAGTGACGQVVPQNGYLTSYIYDDTTLGSTRVVRTTIAQNAQPGGSAQTRTYLYDLVGRLVQSTDPENGTVAYVYDTASSPCANSKGDLVKKTDNAGNVVCFFYDALHRPTSMTYPSGPNSANSATKTFIYDATTFSCSNGSNVKNRLAEAYTGPVATKITDTAFCYSPRGEVTDEYQSTQHSNGTTHLTASYWANGALNVLNGLPGLPSWTYNADGEGRPTTVTAGTGMSPVTAGSYNVFSEVTSVTYGGGDVDTLTYDESATGRMTKYQTSVNSQIVSGTLSWNPNWTLQKNVIVDPLNSVNGQTCNYHYDDLNRASSVDCGTKWNQTFTYDAFGNITKSGSISWQPGYNPANNHYTLGGIVYDNNGNLTTDPLNNYAYDSSGRTTTIGSTTYTFDALGRLVESQTGSSYTQLIYSPSGGRLATMTNAQTALKTFISLPGGGQAVYSGSSLAYYRHADWIGSSRLATTPARTMYFDTGYALFGEDYGARAQRTRNLRAMHRTCSPACSIRRTACMLRIKGVGSFPILRESAQ